MQAVFNTHEFWTSEVAIGNVHAVKDCSNDLHRQPPAEKRDQPGTALHILAQKVSQEPYKPLHLVHTWLLMQRKEPLITVQ